MQQILVVEDDVNLSFLLKSNLEEEGYIVQAAADGNTAWELFNAGRYDLCLLDVMLPKQDGFTLAQMIRKINNSVPILFLTARVLKEDVYRGFESGADDYMVKPFTAKELLFRIKALLRRVSTSTTATAANTVYNIGKLSFNYTTRELTDSAGTKRLSTKENELLRLFCESRNSVLNRNRLLMEVWGSDDYFVSKSLDVYITRLRKLLKDDPNVSIQNFHSIGYKIIQKH